MESDLSNNRQIVCVISCLNSFKTTGFISSGPAALSGFSWVHRSGLWKFLAIEDIYFSSVQSGHPKTTLEHIANKSD